MIKDKIIIDPDGNTVYDSRIPVDTGRGMVIIGPETQLEEVVPNGDQLQKEREAEQAIIAEIRKKIPIGKLPI